MTDGIAYACESHPKSPELGCDDCERAFCADCAMPLTNRNSGLGMDICDDCESGGDNAKNQNAAPGAPEPGRRAS